VIDDTLPNLGALRELTRIERAQRESSAVPVVKDAVQPRPTLRRRAFGAVAALLLLLAAAALWRTRSHGLDAPEGVAWALEGAAAGRKAGEIPR
jgi:hypothetical protein